MLEPTESDPAGEGDDIGVVSAHEIERRLHGPDKRAWVSLWVQASDQAAAWQLKQPDLAMVDRWHLAAQYAEERAWEEEKRQRRQAKRSA